jgi:hypothetical protein
MKSRLLGGGNRVLIIVLVMGLLLTATQPQPLVAQGEETDPVLALMEQLTVEEKVGQLFLVPFIGQDLGLESDIASLITDFHIGGVVLLERNGNIVNEGETALQVANAWFGAASLCATARDSGSRRRWLSFDPSNQRFQSDSQQYGYRRHLERRAL